MRRRVLTAVILIGLAAATGAAATAPGGAAGTGVKTLKPVEIGNLPLSFKYFAMLPGGRSGLTSESVMVIDAGQLFIFLWRWWLGGLLALVWLIALWRQWRRWRGRLTPGMEYCRRCKYCLQGTAGAACPECGGAIGKAGRIVGRRVRWRGVLVLPVLMAGGFIALDRTAKLWQDRVTNLCSLQSESLYKLVDKYKLDDRVSQWTGVDLRQWEGSVPSIIEVSTETGKQVRFISSGPRILGSEFSPGLISPDGSKAICWFFPYFWTGGYDQTWELIDLHSGREIRPPAVFRQAVDHETDMNGTHSRMCFSLNGRSLYVWRSHDIMRWDIEMGQITTVDHALTPANPFTYAMEMIAPDQLALISGATPGHGPGVVDIAVFDSRTGANRSRHPLATRGWPVVEIKAGKAYILDGAWEQWNGKTYDAMPGDKMTVWDLAAGKAIAAWPGDGAEMFKLCGSDMLILGRNGMPTGNPWLEARDAMTGRVLGQLDVDGREFDPHTDPDGTRVLLTDAHLIDMPVPAKIYDLAELREEARP